MSARADWKRVRRLGRYLIHDRRRLLLTLVMLVPVALAGAIQPLLVGQAISVLRGEASFSWLADLGATVAIRVIVGLLLLSVLVRLALQGVQSFNIQAVGQRLTARSGELRRTRGRQRHGLPHGRGVHFEPDGEVPRARCQACGHELHVRIGEAV